MRKTCLWLPLAFLLAACTGSSAATPASRSVFSAEPGSCRENMYIDIPLNLDSNTLHESLADANVGKLDKAIADQTAVINSANVSHTDLVIAFLLRSVDYSIKQDYRDALSDANSVVALDSGDPYGFMLRAFVYGTSGNLDGALSDSTTAIKLDPTDSNAFGLRALVELRKQAFAQAITDASRMISLCPSDARGYSMRAYAFENTGDNDAGISDDTRAIALEPDNADAYIDRGRAYGNEGKWNEDIADETRAIIIKPSFSNALIERGNAYTARRQYEAAVTDETAAIKISPDAAAGYIDRSMAYEAEGRSADAISDDMTAIILQPRSSTAWNNLCWDRASVGDLGAALDACNLALRLTYNDPDYLDLKMKNYKAAIIDYDAALKLRPTLASSLYGRGLAEQALQETGPANADIISAKEADPGIASEFAE